MMTRRRRRDDACRPKAIILASNVTGTSEHDSKSGGESASGINDGVQSAKEKTSKGTSAAPSKKSEEKGKGKAKQASKNTSGGKVDKTVVNTITASPISAKQKKNKGKDKRRVTFKLPSKEMSTCADSLDTVAAAGDEVVPRDSEGYRE
jgi:hypothetical protein